MTELVYMYRSDPLDGEELRYSLRSVEANLHMPQIEVTIVGGKPEWLTGVTHVECDPYPENKCRAWIEKMWLAGQSLQDRGIDQAIYLDDDYTLHDPAEDVLPCYWGPLADHVKQSRSMSGRNLWYREAMYATQRLLSEDARSWEMHRPLRVESAPLTGLMGSLRSMRESPFWRTMYGNLVGYRRPVFRAIDGRFYGSSHIPGIPWVSTEEGVFEGRLGNLIRERFSTPSRWES